MILLFLAALILAAAITVFLLQKMSYEKTDYYTQTKNSYISMILDKGRLGEFYTYKYLKPLKGHKRYLFNLYLPPRRWTLLFCMNPVSMCLSPRITADGFSGRNPSNTGHRPCRQGKVLHRKTGFLIRLFKIRCI